MKALANLFAIVVTAAVLCGCDQPPNTVGNSPPRPVEEVQVVHMDVTPPTPLNWDNRPGADGVQIRVFFEGSGTLPVTVSGSVEAQLFELAQGKTEGEALSGKPFKVWSYTPGELNGFLARTQYGWAYVLVLAWGDQVPKTGRIVLRVAYRSPAGRVNFSSPVTIQMSAS